MRRTQLKTIVLALSALILLTLTALFRGGVGYAEDVALATIAAYATGNEAPDSTRAASANEGRLVLLTGQPTIEAPPRVSAGRIEAEDTLALSADGQRYEKKDDNYSFRSDSYEVSYAQAKLGPLRISADLLARVGPFQPYRLSEAQVAKLDPGRRYSSHEVFYGRSPSRPQVGDRRVDFEHVPNQVITVLAPQRGSSLEREVQVVDLPLLPMSIGIGVAKAGRHDLAAMRAAQRESVAGDGSFHAFFGLLALWFAGWLALAAMRAWQHAPDPTWMQTVLKVAWAGVPWLLRPIEELAAPLATSLPARIAVSAVLVTGAVAGFLALHRALPRWSGRSAAAGRGLA